MQEKKKYDITILFTSEDFNVDKLINDFQGEVVSKGSNEKISLAYPIKKNESAFMRIVLFNMDPDSLADFDNALRLDKDVLRHMIITVEDKPLSKKKKSIRTKSEKDNSHEGETSSSNKDSNGKSSASDVLTNEDLEKTIKELQ